MVALSVLIGYAQLVGLDTLHIFGLNHTINDQVVYIDAARHLRDDCELTTGIIYPDTLRQDYSRNYLYMPGHAVVLALSLFVFGDGVWQAILPSIIGYLGSVFLVFVIGRRLRDTSVGIWAALLFAVFAPNVVYAMTAMAEATFLCACLMAFSGFLFLPQRLRTFLGPLLLILPFLFRETGSLWVIPMAFVILERYPSRRRGYGVAAAFVAVSVVVLSAVYQIEWLSDRPSRLWQNLSTSEFDLMYADAFGVIAAPESLGGWLGILASHAVSSLSGLIGVLGGKPTSFEAVSLHLLLWPIALVALLWRLGLGVRQINRACLATGLTLVVLISFLYSWDHYVGVRQLLLLLPLESIALAAGAGQWLSGLEERKRRLCGATVVLCLVLGSGYQLLRAADEVKEWDDLFAAVERSLRVIGPDTNGTLIAPYWVGAAFVHTAYPAQWAFSPANPATLELLHEKHPVRTAILPLLEFRRLGTGVLERIELSYAGRVELGGVTHLVYRSAGAATNPDAK